MFRLYFEGFENSAHSILVLELMECAHFVHSICFELEIYKIHLKKSYLTGKVMIFEFLSVVEKAKRFIDLCSPNKFSFLVKKNLG